MFDSEKLTGYWLTTALDDLDTCHQLFSSKKYHHALYFGQMYLENFVELAKRTQIDFSENDKDVLEEISTFNMEARYDNDKFDFYKKSTLEYASTWLKHIERLGLWIQQTYLANTKLQLIK